MHKDLTSYTQEMLRILPSNEERVRHSFLVAKGTIRRHSKGTLEKATKEFIEQTYYLLNEFKDLGYAGDNVDEAIKILRLNMEGNKNEQ